MSGRKRYLRADDFLKLLKTKAAYTRFTMVAGHNIRTEADRICPIEFVAGVNWGEYEEGAKQLGIGRKLQHDIVNAADTRLSSLGSSRAKQIRIRLLEILRIA